MTISKNLQKYLEKENVYFEPMHHAVAYTASEVAGAQHVPGDTMLKPVIAKCDGKYVMFVVPATYWLDFDKVKEITQSKEVELASEDEIRELFPDDQLGAEPPIGKLYNNMPMWVDEHVKECDKVIFNGGTHTDCVKMKCSDYLTITKPKFGDVGRHV